MRAYSDRDSNAAFFFRRCNSCANGLKYFQLKKGWHSYDLDMTGPWDLDGLPGSSLPPVSGTPWGGQIEMLWMITSFDAGNLPEVSIDDLGIVAPTAGPGLSIGATGGPAELWMDLDGNTANDGTNKVVGATASYLTTVTGPTNIGLPAGVLQPGQTARFYTRRNGVATTPSATRDDAALVRPEPRALSPWETAGTDWATAVRRDPWDMTQPSDARVVNAAWSFSGGFLHGWTGPGTRNDPVVPLSVNTPIDAELYHRVVLTITYDGPWGLENVPGGGLVGRIVRHPYGGVPYQVSDDLVLRTGPATYVVEMKTWPRRRSSTPTATPTRSGGVSDVPPGCQGSTSTPTRTRAAARGTSTTSSCCATRPWSRVCAPTTSCSSTTCGRRSPPPTSWRTRT